MSRVQNQRLQKRQLKPYGECSLIRQFNSTLGLENTNFKKLYYTIATINGRRRAPDEELEAEGNPGLLLGLYEIGKILGYGTFTKVYHTRNLKTGEGVAIKVIDKEKILKIGLIAHIKRDISILREVRHPNIIQLFEVMATKSKNFFVMEYVKGGELFNKVAKGRLKEGLVRKYFQQLISAMAFSHARGVYHRDLKPENILLDEDGNLKVSDFELSAISE